MASADGRRPTRTSRSRRNFLNHVEEHAAALRTRAKVGPLEHLDPRALAVEFGVVVVDSDALVGLSATDRAHLGAVDARTWSGMGVPLPNGRLVVVLHPRQTVERANVTIMEEIAHAHYGHRPSRFIADPSGLVRREYERATEDEAYWTAAAALLPAMVVARAVWQGRSAANLASEYGTSEELVEFRIKVLGLWSDYVGRAA